MSPLQHSPRSGYQVLLRRSSQRRHPRRRASGDIVVIMGDDIGMWSIGAYHRGLMAGRTPNLDKLAAEGMLFTDYMPRRVARQVARKFITGESADPHRHDHGRPGRRGHRIPAEAVTIATALKGWVTRRPVRQE